MKKQIVWLWSEGIQIKKMTEEDRKGYNNPCVTIITPAENVANILEVCPSDGIESLIELIYNATKYSQEMNESPSQTKARIHTAIFSVTTEAKNL